MSWHAGEIKALIAPALDLSAEDIRGYVVLAELEDGGMALCSNGDDETTASLLLHMVDHMFRNREAERE